MTLKVDLTQFLDERGNVLELTEQAKKVFTFLTIIVSSVSANIEQSFVHVDLRCNTRAEGLSCEGYIEAENIEFGIIEWRCDACEASGKISNWRGSSWDKKKHTIH